MGAQDRGRRAPSQPLRARDDDNGQGGTVAELRPTEDATHEVPRRFERRAAELLTEQPLAERRTVTITGHPTPARRRAHSVMKARWRSPSGSASGPSCSASS